MLGKVWKRISGKLPAGKQAVRLGIGLSAAVWVGAGVAFFLLKDKQTHAGAENHGAGLAAETSGHDGHGHDGNAGGHGDEHGEAVTAGASIHGHAPETNAGHGGNAHVPQVAASGSHAGHDVGPGNHETSPSQNHGGLPAEGHGAAHHGEAEDAEALARQVPTPEEIRAQRQVAELLAADGDLAKAVAPMRRVMLQPTREPVLLSLAVKVFLGTANYSEALGFANQLAALAPNDAENNIRLVEAQYRLGQVEKAFQAAESALRQQPGDLGMLTQLGTMEIEMGTAHPAYGKSLAAALKVDPNYGPAVYLQGRKSQLEGDYRDAEAAFAKVVQMDPGNAKALGQLGMAQYHLGRYVEAERSFKAELAMNPADYNTWYNLGELHLVFANGETQVETVKARRADALECYLQALELNPDHAQARYRVGVLMNGNGQFKEAIRHLQAALKTDSRHVPTLLQLSLAYENLKQLERARDYLNKAFELDPLNKVVLFKLRRLS